MANIFFLNLQINQFVLTINYHFFILIETSLNEHFCEKIYGQCSNGDEKCHNLLHWMSKDKITDKIFSVALFIYINHKDENEVLKDFKIAGSEFITAWRIFFTDPWPNIRPQQWPLLLKKHCQWCNICDK